MEIDHEIISTVILLPSADSFKKGCCQLQAKVCARITGYPLVQACPGKSVVRWTDRPAMTIAVDLGRKATKQTKQNRPLVKSVYQKKYFSYFSTKTYVVGTQKNCLNETVLLSTQNIFLNWWVRKYLHFYAQKFCLSRLNLWIYLIANQNCWILSLQVSQDHQLLWPVLVWKSYVPWRVLKEKI